ncbi:mucin-binding protein [Lactobacillus amylovorus]|uniref:mucin-binding protein n=1 Tax=Lactobacillus amylovorus TaxID=1604 RepID=UPI002244A17F|nr:YSIRK-type signal peptide-containing protein [Lactobacillus amylovorus]
MVSKNNRIKRMEEAAERQSHFGIRKLTVGAASVLLGITLLFGANAKVARADETNAQTGTSAVETKVTTGASAAESDNNKGKKTNQSSTDVHVLDSNESTTINNGENEAKGVTQKTTSMVAVKTRQSNLDTDDIAKTTGASGIDAQPNVNTSATQGADTKQGENPDWYMTDPSKATDENAARGNLEQAIAYAKAHPIKGLDIKGEQDAEGRITVAPDPKKEDANDAITIAYDNEKDSAQYMQSIANKIWDEIKTYEAYEAERETFMDGLAAEGLYDPKTDVDPTTLSQHLTLDSEPDAIVNLEIKKNSGDWETATENDLLTIDNAADKSDKSDLDTMGSKRGWTVTFKKNGPVNDPFIRLTFTNLKNSHYDDGTNAAVVPIDKIVETFSNVYATNGEPAKFLFASDPTRGWWYDHCSGVTATIQLYGEYDKTDENGRVIKDKDGKVEKEEKLITFNQPVYMSVSSLNSGEEKSPYKESAQLESSGKAYRIPESSVIADDKNKLYSPYYNNWYFDAKNDTDYYNYWGRVFEPAAWKGAADEETKVRDLGKHIVETYKGWDNPDQYNRIFGSGLYKVNEDPIIVRSYVGGSQENQSISKYNHVWFAYSTIIPKTTFDAKHPGTTINYHFAKKINVNTSQTVEFVDDQGNQLIKPNDIQSGFSFQIKDGKPTVESHTYNNVPVPVIPGYVADKTRIQDKDGTYVSGPKIIVDKDGGAYVPGQMVTVDNPNVTIEVVYTPVDTTQHAVVNYLDSDEGNKQITTSGDLTGPAGAKIDYNTKQTIDDLEGEGYELVRDGFPKDSVFDHDKTTTQTYEVILKHAHITVTPDKPGNGLDHDALTKTVTEEVNYVVDGGEVQAPATKDASLTFKGTAYYDAVTKKWTDASGKELTDQTKNITWTAQDGHHFGVVVSPEVKGYHVTKVSGNYNDGNGNVKAINDITENSNNITVTVHYTPNGKIIPVDPSGKPIPNVPTPTYPTDPKDPMKVVPDEPVPDVPGRTPEVSTVTPKDPSKDTPVVYTPVDTTQHAVVNYLDSDEGNKQITTSGDLTGPAGAKIDYNTKQTIDDLEGEGYELVRDGFPKDSVFDHDKTTTQTYEVILKHAHITVTPDKPGNGLDHDALTKTVTEEVNYVVDGGEVQAPATKDASLTFKGTAYYDAVTKKWTDASGKELTDQTKNITWTAQDGHHFGVVVSPEVKGYHVTKVSGNYNDGNGNVKAINDITENSNNITVTVHYTPNGKIIPVDPSGKPIPNVPTPTYPTDPKDPMKVVPDEPVPDVPGRTPEVSTVTPKDPSKDTPVVYTPVDTTQHAVVNYLDSDEGNKQITTSGDLTGPAGAKIDYNTKQTIDDLEGEGYELVRDGFPKDSVFDHDKTTTQTYEVILKHAHITVTPDKPGNGLDHDALTKTVTEEVNYVVDGGEVQAPATKDASLTFKGTAYYDAVTKKWTDASGKELTDQTKNITWTAQDGHHFGVVVSPEVKGYHVTKVSGNYNDGNGNVKAINDITENSNNITVTVHYTPNGKIIPVDPSGKPIPNVPTPTYPTDPKDPMKVVPDEPVPDVPGRTPEVSTVTPKDPSKDTPVVYTPVDTTQHAVVNYLDSDEGNKQITTSGDLTGPAGAKIDYNTKQTIDDLEGEGYELVRDGFPKDSVFDHDKTTTQTYEVILKHAHITVTPDKPGNGLDHDALTKTVTEEVNYVVDGGEVQAPATKDASLTFKGTAYYDAVTKKWTDASGKELTDQTKNITWTAQDGHHFGVVVSPEVKGYHVTKVSGNYNDGNGNVKAINDITENSNNITVTVHYTPNGKIIPVDPSGKPIPNVPTPTYPTDPKDPMKVVPDEPVPDVPGRTPEVSTVTPKDPSKDTPVVYTPVDTTQHAVVNYLDSDEGNKQITTSGDLTGPAGAKIDYNTKQTIDDLEGEGYELVRDGFPKDSVFDHDKTTTQTYEVILKHAHITVTPDKPGNGLDHDALTKTVTEEVNYVVDGGEVQAPATKDASLTFKGTAYYDAVTKKWTDASGKELTDQTKNITWTAQDGHHFGVVVSPEVKGYHVTKVSGNYNDGNGNVKAINDITENSNNITVTVHYTPNGKIIPVDPSGKPIPNVPTPTYPTDPKDPMKVVPDEPVPDVPGRTPEVSTVTPKDPSKDTPVVYTPVDTTQHAVVNYLDSDEGNKQITTSGDLTGPAGAKIDYNTKQTIDDLEGEGYELVRDGFPKDSVFDHDKTTTQTYEVILKHAHITVTPDKPGNGLDHDALTKTVTEEVNYVVDGGEVQAPATKDASLTFKGTAYYDAVTKKWTDASGKELTDQTKNITWTAQDGHHFGVVVSPEVKGYHVTKVSGNYNDGNGNVKAINDITENSNNITVTVHYTPNGKIIPVDPSGKPIPNVPTPTYPTDPKDPMKVVPDEPVPDVPGRTPEVSTVTPKDPSKDTPVVYTPVDTTQHAVVNYLDSDEGNKQITTSGDLTGPAGAKIDYNTKQTIDDLEGEGYELVRDGFPKDSVFDHDKTTTQTYEVILKHAHITVTPDKPGDPKKPINPDDPKGPKYPEGTTKNDLTKDSTQTIIYHYSDGSKPDEKKTETYEDTFTRTKVVDKVTGEVIKTTPWTGSHTFDSKDVPVVNGYHSDKKTVGGKTATVNNPDVTDTVTYTPNGKIIPVDPSGKPIPNVPTPTYPTDPNDPTKVVPNEPVPDVPGRTPEASTVTPKDPSKDTPVVYNSIPNVPGPSDGPSDNTPTPVTPTPGKTTEEKKPDENKGDKDVNEPDDDEDVVPTPRHHKKHNGGESSTTRPRPTGYTPAPRGSGYLDANGKVHYKLPQTGESDSEEMAAVLGGAATAIGLIGLAGAKKRRHE